MKKIISLVFVFVLCLHGLSPAQAGSILGKPCTSIGQIKNISNLKYICVSKNLKNVWMRSPANAKSYSPKGFSGWSCEADPKISGQGSIIQNFVLCAGPMKIIAKSLTSQIPVSKEIRESTRDNIENCKIQNADSSESWKGFPTPSKSNSFLQERHPAPSTVMQIVPIYASDASKGKGSPYQDYKFYFDFIKKYFSYIDDTGGNFELRVPENYINFSKPVKPYGIRHGNDDPLSKKFVQDVISEVDKEINFSDVNFSLIVVPAGTPSGVIGQQGFPGALSQEKYLSNVAVAQPATFKGPNNTVTPYMASPSMWLHEFFHPGLNLGDNHGGDSRFYDNERGMGDWGLMSRNNGDLLAWQKWILGFLGDTQVRCLELKNVSSMNWIAPSSVKTKMDKLVVIPLNQSRAIVVESIRAFGLSYQFSTSRLGALVYLVDSADVRHTLGYTILYPDNRRPKLLAKLLMEDAPLKLGESVTIEGVKITNVEWGEFGDVIKVEPVK